MKKTIIIFSLILGISIGLFLKDAFAGNVTAQQKGSAILSTGTSQNGGTTLSTVASSIKNPRCLDNYQSWNTSTTYNPNNNWSTDLIDSQYLNPAYYTYPYHSITQDINGDGLPDYVYVSSYSSGGSMCGTQIYIPISTCVGLNNGHGWTIVYKCVAVCDTTVTPNVLRFYGNCAG